MSKKTIMIILLIMLSIGLVSLYTTFALDEEATTLEESDSDYNLIYSLKESSNKYISVSAKDETYVDIDLKNTYQSTVRYGMYYYVVNPTKLPDIITITISPDSPSPKEDIIKPGETKTVTIKINNNSEYNVDLLLGALIGFENGKIEELVKDGEILIK